MKKSRVKSTEYFLRAFTAALFALLCLSALLPVSSWAEAPAETAEAPPLVRLSELMVKNHATLSDENGELPDYIEIENLSDSVLELEGYGLADSEDAQPWLFPACSLPAGERLLVYADKGGSADGSLHADFAISYGETVYLFAPDGSVADSALCDCDTADIALVRDHEGRWQQSLYPSPGYENSPAGYDAWQESLRCSSPLQIYEAMVYNDSLLKQNYLGFCDWLEIKNVSDGPVQLSDYWLSDDDDQLRLWRFPEKTLAPGKSLVLLCDDSSLPANSGQLRVPFSLSAERERLYLSHDDGSLSDYVFLRDIPYACSYGRQEGQMGWFFFAEPSPGEDNEGGLRRVSRSPVSLEADGVFAEGGVKVALSGAGEIRYTTDGSLPTASSPLYEGSFTVEETGIVRAVCIEEGALPSRPLTLSYIIGEGHSLPVLSLVTNDDDAFRRMYNGKRKDMEVPGSLSLYEPEGSFTIPVGIEMHGEASLSMPKKSMSVKMRGAYGQDMLSYDAFDGGVTEFTDFVLRAGQDFPSTIVRSELLVNLCLQYSQSVPTQRSKPCVLYIDGEYSGIYTIMEKLNEQHYAALMGVEEDSVTVIKAKATPESSFYKEVLLFSQTNDLRKPEAYEAFCRMVDIDSLIDWMIIEGYSANTDIGGGNVRYVRSTQGDGKWRFMLYDMDSTLEISTNRFRNVLMPSSTQCAVFITQLMENEDFAHRFLTRAAELLSTTLSEENVLAELERLCTLIEPEVGRDYARFGRRIEEWKGSVETLRMRLIEKQWSAGCVDALCSYFRLTPQQRVEYFGS